MIHGDWGLRARAELLRALVVKEFKVRYRSAALGSLWAVINPLVLMTVLSVVLGGLVPMEFRRYPLFLLAGLVPWAFFASGLRGGAASVLDNSSLLRKVAFPRILLPLAATAASLLHFSIALGLLLAAVLLTGRGALAPLLALPLVVALQVVFVAGCAMGLSVAQARWRDVRYLVDAALLVGFYATPVIFPPEVVPQPFRTLVDWNPVAVHLTLYRAVLVEGVWPAASSLGIGGVTAALAFGLGAYAFTRVEPDLADFA